MGKAKTPPKKTPKKTPKKETKKTPKKKIRGGATPAKRKSGDPGGGRSKK